MNYVLSRIDLLITEHYGKGHGRFSAFARHVGIPYTTVKNWFDNDSTPSAPNLIKICKAFGIELSQLLYGRAPNDWTPDQAALPEDPSRPALGRRPTFNNDTFTHRHQVVEFCFDADGWRYEANADLPVESTNAALVVVDGRVAHIGRVFWDRDTLSVIGFDGATHRLPMADAELIRVTGRVKYEAL